MFLIVGLGNPGNEYFATRHNIGFTIVENMIAQYNFPKPKSKFKAMITENSIADKKFMLAMPMTYMNNSGQSVSEITKFYKIDSSQIIVIHDDLDIPLGSFKIKRGGGHGGHNGLRSIDNHIGKDYLRIRIGIGHPGDKDLVSPYVLGNFSKAESKEKEYMVNYITDHIIELANTNSHN